MKIISPQAKNLLQTQPWGETRPFSTRSDPAGFFVASKRPLLATLPRLLPAAGAPTVTRLRGRPLQTLRRRIFLAKPLCVLCERAGRLSVATDLDHIVALVNGGGNEEENLQGLCASCHVEKTAVDLGQQVRSVIGPDGWPV